MHQPTDHDGQDQDRMTEHKPHQPDQQPHEVDDGHDPQRGPVDGGPPRWRCERVGVAELGDLITGHDSAHDLLNLKSMVVAAAGINVDFAVDPQKALPLRTTTYYVLSPGENRVRALTATVLPGWVKRCGVKCGEIYNQVIAPISGVKYTP